MKTQSQTKTSEGNAPREWHTTYSDRLERDVDRLLDERDAARAQRDELLAALKGVAGDSIAMRGFHEQFRAQIRAAIAKTDQ